MQKCINGGHPAERDPLPLCDGSYICRLCACHMIEVYLGIKNVTQPDRDEFISILTNQ